MGVCGDENPLLNAVTTVLKLMPEIDRSSPLIHQVRANMSAMKKMIGEEYCSVRCVQDMNHKYDCSRFTQCAYQPDVQLFLKKEFKCPKGMHFNEQRGYCSDIDPQERREMDSNTEDGADDERDKASSSRAARQYASTQVPQCRASGRFRIQNNCQKYQICQPSAIDLTVFVSEIEHCLTGLVFSNTTKSCLLPSQVPECSGGVGSTQVTQCTAVGYFRIPSNCSRYLICYPDAYNTNVYIPDLGECPQGLFFSQTARACVLPSQVPECSTKTNNITAAAPLPICTSSGNFRLGTECGRYISCIPDANNPGSFITQIVNCPTGRVYSSVGRTCLPPAQVPVCSSFYPRCIGAGNFRLGMECKTYLACIPDPNNPGTFIAQIARCPTGLDFSPTQRVCLPTVQVPECVINNRNDIIVANGFALNVGQDLVCTTPGNFNIGDHCDHYLKCIRSSSSTIIAKVEVCINRTVFNPDKRICVPTNSRPQCQNGVDKSLSTLFGRQTLLCTAAGSFRIANSCTQYLQCTANPSSPGTFVSQILSCPVGMAFSPVTSGCLPATQVPGCGAPPIDTSLAIPTCPAVGNFRLGLECNRYLSCVNDPNNVGQFITQIVSCPSGMAFSTAAGTCRDPNLVPECMALSVPTCTGAGNFKLGTDCSRYLSCIPDPNNPGTFIIQIANCPPRLAFDFRTGTCLPAGQVEHCPIIIPTVIPITVNTTFTPSCKQAGFFRIPTDCTKYLTCFPSPINGTIFVPQILDCPPGLYFSEVQGICQLPSLVPECDQSLPVSCTAAGLFSIPSDCSKYLECSPDPNGNPNVFIPEVKYCLSGLYFSPIRRACLRPVDVPQCGTSTSSGTTCRNIGLFRIPSDCTKYLRCNPNPDLTTGILFIPEVVYCYPGLIFSDAIKACVRPKQVPECKSNVHGTKTALPIQGCNDVGFFPITGDCTHYLACNPSPIHTNSQIFTPSLEKCPNGLFFSPSRRFCLRVTEVPECRSYLSTGFPTHGNEYGNEHINGYSNTYEPPFNGQYNDHYYSRENIDASASTHPQTLAFPNGRIGLCSREGYEAVPNDCSKYVMCTREPSSGSLVAQVEHCPIGKVFSKSSQQCLPQTEVPECSSDVQCTEVGLFHVPNDCQRYTICRRYYNGLRSFLETCPTGQLFSPGNKRCMPEEHVKDCFNLQYRNKNPVQSCPGTGLFPITGDCHNYIMCHSSYQNPRKISAQMQQCPANYAFSATWRKCLPSQQVAECSTVAPPESRPECFSIGNFAHPRSCSKFIRCKLDPNNIYKLVGTVETCPQGTKFAEKSLECVIDHNRECSGADDQFGYRKPSEPIVECKDQYPIRDRNDCSRFYFCSLRSDGAFEAFAFTCPPGYYFDDSPSIRMCQQTSQSYSFIRTCSVSRDDPKAILANSKICRQPGILRKPNDCSHFYHCLIEDGRMKQIEFACPQDYMFSEKYSTCSLAGKEIPRCSTDRGQLDDDVPFTCREEGLFPHSEDCRQYFRCRYNKNRDVFNLSIGECPKTGNGQQLYFNTKSGQCDWPDSTGNANCKIA